MNCLKCGGPVQNGDNYCATCGVRMVRASWKAVLLGIGLGVVLGAVTGVANRLLSIS